MPAARRVVVAFGVLLAGLGCWCALRAEPAGAPAVEPPAAAAVAAPRPKIGRRHVNAAAEPAEAQAAPPRVGDGRLVVRVVERGTRAPIAAAHVCVADAADVERSTKTDAAGVARFERLVGLGAEVLAEATGYVRKLQDDADVSPAAPECVVEMERGGEATGVVLDEAGRPFPDASAMATEDRDDVLDDSVTPLAEARSAADGTFRLGPLPVERTSFLHFTAPGRAVRTTAWTPSAGRVEVRLAPVGRLRVVVRDGTSAAAPDAEVTADSAEGGRLHARTDAGGRCAFDGLCVGDRWTLTARAAGFADAAATIGVVGPQPIDVALRRLPTVEIFAAPAGSGVVRWRVEGAWISVPLVAGRATLGPMAPGACEIALDAPEFVPWETTVDVAPDETKRVDAALSGGSSFAGVVVDDAGAPVAGARIDVTGGVFLRGGDAWRRAAESGADGSFRVSGLTEGVHAIDVRADGHEGWSVGDAEAPRDDLRPALRRLAKLTMRLRVEDGAAPPESVLVCSGLEIDEVNFRHEVAWADVGKPIWIPSGRRQVALLAGDFAPVHADIDVPPGGAFDWDVLLEAGQTVEGIVVDDLGAPVSGAAVGVELPSGRPNAWEQAPFVTTAADGKFRIPRIERSRTSATVSAEARVCGRVEVEVALPSSALRIELPRSGDLVVHARAFDGRGLDLMSSLVIGDWRQQLEDGRVEVPLASHEWDVLIVSPGLAPAPRKVVVAPGRTTTLDVTLERGHVVRGRVVDPEGRPLPGAEIGGFVAWAPWRKTDEAGGFAFEGLPAGETRLRALCEGHAVEDLTCVAGSTDEPLVVTLHRGGVVHGRVRFGADGQPEMFDVAAARVGGVGDRQWAVASRDAYSIRLAAGRWSIAVVSDGVLASREIDVVEGGDHPLDLVVDH